MSNKTEQIKLPFVPDKESSIFLLSWLSNVNAGLVDTVDNLQDRAETNLKAAMRNPYLQASLLPISHLLTESIKWGPVSVAGKAKTIELDLELSVTDNLVYIFKGQQSSLSTKPLYVVAVAGTNPASYDGWYDEDFKPDQMVAWPVVNQGKGCDPATNPYTADSGKGGVAVGFCNGLNIIWGMKDPNTQKSIADFLTDEINSTNADIEIAVAGHSLGGALAPMLALALKEQFSDKANVTVSTYPTAGPTPGDDKFADYLTQTLGADNYISVINSYDVVPKGYANLNNLCNIYNDGNFAIQDCSQQTGPIPSNAPIAGLVTYILNLPAGNVYARSQPDTTFNDKRLNMSGITCYALNNTIVPDVMADSTVSSALTSLGQAWYTHKNMGVYTLNTADVLGLFTFLMEAGYQHTKAYLEHFFGGEIMGFNLVSDSISNYMSKGDALISELAEVQSLQQLFVNAADYFGSNPSNVVWPTCG